MEKLYYKEVGRFKGLSFDGQIFEFIVCENGIFCTNLHDETVLYEKLTLKPSFTFSKAHYTALREKQKYSTKTNKTEKSSSSNPSSLDSYIRENNLEKILICQYLIDDELLAYLIKNKMIDYSTDMAYLYGLDSDYAYDRQYQTRAFKWVKKKSKILTKQKRGFFN